METTLLKDGLIVMLMGMGTVFIFLTVMILMMNLNSIVLKYVNKFFPEEIPVEKKSNKKSAGNNDEIALAIACAINTAKNKTA